MCMLNLDKLFNVVFVTFIFTCFAMCNYYLSKNW